MRKSRYESTPSRINNINTIQDEVEKVIGRDSKILRKSRGSI